MSLHRAPFFGCLVFSFPLPPSSGALLFCFGNPLTFVGVTAAKDNANRV
jgi:hypothetical protein